jgi:hypothetical protein
MEQSYHAHAPPCPMRSYTIVAHVSNPCIKGQASNKCWSSTALALCRLFEPLPKNIHRQAICKKFIIINYTSNVSKLCTAMILDVSAFSLVARRQLTCDVNISVVAGVLSGPAAGHLLSPISQGCNVLPLSSFYQTFIYQSSLGSATGLAYCAFDAQQRRALYVFGQAAPAITYIESGINWAPTTSPFDFWSSVASSADGQVSGIHLTESKYVGAICVSPGSRAGCSW